MGGLLGEHVLAEVLLSLLREPFALPLELLALAVHFLEVGADEADRLRD